MNSKTTVLAVVIFLGLVGIATVTGGFVLAYQGTTIPGELVAIGSGAIGALAGILSKTNTEPAVVDAIGNPAIAIAGPPTPPAPPAPDLEPLRAQLAGAANAILDAANALGDPAAAPEAALVDDALGGQ